MEERGFQNMDDALGAIEHLSKEGTIKHFLAIVLVDKGNGLVAPYNVSMNVNLWDSLGILQFETLDTWMAIRSQARD